MARSKRKTSIMGITNSVSEKQFKRHTSHVFRAEQRRLLKKVIDDKIEPDVVISLLPKKPRDVMNPWSGDKDGKSWFGKWKHKDKKLFDKWMRK